jgi:hypothetical protein
MTTNLTEDYCLLGCDGMQFVRSLLMFWKNILSSSLGLKCTLKMEAAHSYGRSVMIDQTTQHQSQKTVIFLVTVMRPSNLNILYCQFATVPSSFVVTEEDHNNLLNSECCM